MAARSKILGLITARAGSRGVPGKNTRQLCGIPLIVYTLRIAQEAQREGILDRVVLSTDDEAAMALCQRYECEVPFARPALLCNDTASHGDVVLHALAHLKDQGYEADGVMILMPTSPFRQVDDLRHAVSLYRARPYADSIVGVSPCPVSVHPARMVQTDTDHPSGFASLWGGIPLSMRIQRRQDFKPAWAINAALYLIDIRRFIGRARQHHSPWYSPLYGLRTRILVMDPPTDVHIDTLDDWQRAEAIAATLPQRYFPDR